MSGLDRTQTLRIDCPVCHAKGYTETQGVQSMCERCTGSGMLEKEVSYRFETQGRLSKEEVAQEFELPVEEVRDAGHSTGE